MSRKLPDDSTPLDDPLALFESYLGGRIKEDEADRLWRLLREDSRLGERFLEIMNVDLLLRDHFHTERKLTESGAPGTGEARFDSDVFDDALYDTRHDTPGTMLFPTVDAESITGQADDWEQDLTPPPASIFPGETAVSPAGFDTTFSDRERPRESFYTPSPEFQAPARRSIATFPPLTLVLLALFFTGLGVYTELFRMPAGPEPVSVAPDRPKTPDQPTTIAVVTSTVSAEFETDDLGAIVPGRPLSSKNIRLKSGQAELLFYNGTRLVVEGPADLTLLTPRRIFCTEGTLSATVPRSGQGFEVATPFGNIRDLGTKFLVDIDASRSGLHVVEGIVETYKNGDELRKLHAGEALAIGPGGVVSGSTPDPRSFVESKVFSARARQERRLRLSERPSLETDRPRPVLVFQPDHPSPGVVVEGGATVEGSTPDRKAMKFLIRSDLVRLGELPSLDSMTLAVRFRLKHLDLNCNPILMSRGVVRGGVLWQILPGGEISFSFRLKSDQRATAFNTPIVLTEDTIDRWLHLAVVVDGKRSTITQYLDGEIIASHRYSSGGPFRLDGASLGNWILNSGPIRQLNAEIESLHIYDRPLGHEGIDDLYLRTVSIPPETPE